MKRLRILLLTNSLGGVKRHVLDLAAGLDRDRYEVVGIFPDKTADPQLDEGGGAYQRAFNALGLPFLTLELPRRPTPDMVARAIARLIPLLRELKPDVLHCHSTMGGAVGRIARLFAPAMRVVYTPHLMFYQCFKGIKRRACLMAEKALLPLCDSMIAVSASECAALRRDMGTERIRQINNGVALPPLPDDGARHAILRELGLSGSFGEGLRLILCPSRFEPQKDVQALLRGVAGLNGTGPEVRVLLAGTGEERELLERLAAGPRLAGKVMFLGWREDMDRLMAAADIVVLPSRVEGCPYVALEAAAHARPLIGSDVQGVRDCIRHGETGFLVPSGDDEAMTRSLATLLDRPALRRRFGMAGRDMVARDFSLPGMLRSTSDVYETLCADAMRKDGRRR